MALFFVLSPSSTRRFKVGIFSGALLNFVTTTDPPGAGSDSSTSRNGGGGGGSEAAEAAARNDSPWAAAAEELTGHLVTVVRRSLRGFRVLRGGDIE